MESISSNSIKFNSKRNSCKEIQTDAVNRDAVNRFIQKVWRSNTDTKWIYTEYFGQESLEQAQQTEL